MGERRKAAYDLARAARVGKGGEVDQERAALDPRAEERESAHRVRLHRFGNEVVERVEDDADRRLPLERGNERRRVSRSARTPT